MKARLVPWRHLLSRHVFGISASFCFLRPDCTSGVETGVTALRETSVFIESWHRRSGRIPAPVASCTSSAFLNLIPSFAHPQDSIRAVLGNLDNLQPFATEHFIVFPYKSKWERVSHLKFKHGEIVLVPYPFVFTLYVEMKWFHENLSPGEPINDSPLGLVLAERKAAGAMTRKRKQVEVPSSPSRPALDRTKMGISSQGPSKKKPLMETRRNGGRKTQQEWQETPTFNTADIQEQDSKWEDSLAEQIIPPLKQNNPPPPKGPKELGTSGFFGFLSSLFPFRYFFRRNSQ
ncbi:membrane-anchored junction protein isoform X1 [Lutra lutra]|uniref:membrane-anchored junction protein isoform X1 n=2 Tax=Lutra lutra TaxID=9657 RepID=UPI001FCFA737|nr:membrane-anchored junction protein isoform X1 [Lutra lutra]